MGDQDTSTSSSTESSPSEGEYIIQEDGCNLEDGPRFDFSEWSPEAPAGLQFLSLIPLGSNGYEVPKINPECSHVGKIRVCTSHRKARLRNFAQGSSVGRNILDERKLRQAVSDDDYNTAESLIESGVDPSCCDDKKRTPLHFAAARGSTKLVSMLLAEGADPNLKDTLGNTPLHLAACTSNIAVITLLLKSGTNVKSLDNSGRSPLHLAHSRLRFLKDESKFSSERLKSEVTQIVNMMKEYLHIQGGHDVEISSLNDLCSRLALTSTKEEVDLVNDLLTDFTSLTIQKQNPG